MQTISVTIPMPTLNKFLDLYDKYPLTLNCPCNQTTLKYNKFVSYIKPQYHEICSSQFVSSNWINVEFVKSPSTPIDLEDIRSQFQIYFQLLSTLCHAANQTVEDNLQLFYRTEFLSQHVFSRESFQIQIDLIVEQFKRTIPESFQNTLELIKANQELNQFVVPMNSLFSRSIFYSYRFTYIAYFDSERPDCVNSDKLECRCFTMSTSECYRKIKIMKNIIPGMFLTWFPLQSILMSTLECLYNDSCLFQIISHINVNVSSINFTTLNLSSEYNTNNSYDEIEILANKLFIQSWNYQSSFESYFNQCYPLKCQYTYQSRLILIYVITTIIGFIGGLTIALDIIAPLIVKLAHKVRHSATCQQRRNIILTVESSSIRLGKKI
jgi:hypothetical protein